MTYVMFFINIFSEPCEVCVLKNQFVRHLHSKTIADSLYLHYAILLVAQSAEDAQRFGDTCREDAGLSRIGLSSPPGKQFENGDKI